MSCSLYQSIGRVNNFSIKYLQFNHEILKDCALFACKRVVQDLRQDLRYVHAIWDVTGGAMIYSMHKRVA